jgi:acyl-homoserine lactone acylase PvdQ
LHFGAVFCAFRRACRRKYLSSLQLLLVCLVLFSASPSKAAAHSGLEAWLTSAPPRGQVTIYRDPWGVPHIQARGEEDGFYGLGYAVAEDYLEDILRQFVIGRGEMARYFGPDYVEIDHLYALLGVGPQSQAGFKRLPEQVRRDMDAYVEGIERYIADHPQDAPSWARELKPTSQDLVGFEQLFVLMFPVNALTGIGDCRRGGIDLPSTFNAFVNLIRTGGPGGASNAWAVAPWRTADGVTIHLADPHNDLYIPSPEFRFHAGDLEMDGFLTAVPFMLTGHTRMVAWGTTFGSPDPADCYAIEVDPQESSQFLFDGKVRTIEREGITIAVRGAEPKRFELEYAPLNGQRAPIVKRAGNIAYAIATPYLDRAEGSVIDLYNMAKARDMYAFRTAMSDQGLLPVSITAADASGNLFYARSGLTPVRDEGYDWTKPVPGNSSATAWKGVHPFSDLIQVMNPKQGYIHENNLSPADMWGADPPVDISKYPKDIVSDMPELTRSVSPVSRGTRSETMLSRAYALTVKSAIDIAIDETWPFVARWQQALLTTLHRAIINGEKLTADQKQLADRILRFNGAASRDSREALAYDYWMEGIAAAGGGSAAARVQKLVHEVQDGREVDAEDLQLLLAGLRAGSEKMRKDFGSGDPVYGDVFRIGRGGETFPLGGCNTPFEFTFRNYACFSSGGGTQRLAMHGQKEFTLTVFSNPIQSFSLSAFGSNWRPDRRSKHFNDQSRLASERQLKPTYFEYDQLMSVNPAKMTLTRRESAHP